jgi:hypothetical protein
VAERLQVPADYPAATLLVMLAGALGRRALIRPQRYDHWVVVPNLWGAIIGRSGVMKSAVLRAVLGPLRRRQALAMAIYESERDAYLRTRRGEVSRSAAYAEPKVPIRALELLLLDAPAPSIGASRPWRCDVAHLKDARLVEL